MFFFFFFFGFRQVLGEGDHVFLYSLLLTQPFLSAWFHTHYRWAELSTISYIGYLIDITVVSRALILSYTSFIHSFIQYP